jgi:hypothetical protein
MTPTAEGAARASDVVASYLATVDGQPISGDVADSLSAVIAHIAHSETLWALALAEREAFQKKQAVEQGIAA